MKSKTALAVCSIAIIFSGCQRQEEPKKLTPAKNETKALTPANSAPEVYEVRLGERVFESRLLRGFYEPTDGWRWTARRFAVSLDVPPPTNTPTFLDFDFSVPVELLTQVREVTLVARVNGRELGRHTYQKEDRYNLQFEVPQSALTRLPAEVEFEIDKAAKDPSNGRELGLIAVSVTMKHPETEVLDRESASVRARQGYLEMIKRRGMEMPPEKQNEFLKLFHDLPVWRNMWFQNVQIEKNPLDLWMMQQIIYETQPDFIIETGTYKGGSALYWAYTLNAMGFENARVFTVDIQDQTSTAGAHSLWKKYVTFLRGSSTDPAIVSQIAGKVKGRKVLVTLDSDHSMQHVLNELHAYAPMVSKGSYLVVEDSHLDGVPSQPDFGPGPMGAIDKFLKEGGSKNYEQDFAREALLITFNPGGWLRRK